MILLILAVIVIFVIVWILTFRRNSLHFALFVIGGLVVIHECPLSWNPPIITLIYMFVAGIIMLRTLVD
jgi:hypothetical protein